jgi:hypothetical protein
VTFSACFTRSAFDVVVVDFKAARAITIIWSWLSKRVAVIPNGTSYR